MKTALPSYSPCVISRTVEPCEESCKFEVPLDNGKASAGFHNGKHGLIGMTLSQIWLMRSAGYVLLDLPNVTVQTNQGLQHAEMNSYKHWQLKCMSR